MKINKYIVGQFYTDVINKGNEDVMKEIVSDNFIDHYASPNHPKGINGFKEFLNMIATAFPDIQVKVEDMIQEGDKMAVRLTIEGTHTGTLMGRIPASGRKAVWTGIDILKIENGKITERWSQRDLLELMRQIGVLS